MTDIILKEEEIKEEIITVSVAVLLPLVLNLVTLFYAYDTYRNAFKEDATLSKTLNGILKDGKKWKVLIVPTDGIAAFCMITPMVFLSRGLLKMMSDREIEAIMLHEAGHIKNKDTWKFVFSYSTIMGILLGALVAYTGPAAFGVSIFCYFIMDRIGLIHILLKRMVGRKAENRADSFAVKYGYEKELISSLEKIEKLFSKNRPPCTGLCKVIDKINKALNEHPPLKKRVENILKAKETWTKIKNKSVITLTKMFRSKFGIANK